MNDHKKYYITQSNLKRLVYQTRLFEQSISDIYHTIYDRLDLRKFVSTTEARQLGALAAFLQASEDYLVELAKNRKSRNTDQKTNPFLFVSGPPKYHKDGTCETLMKDFENFEIPEEIRIRGEQAIEDFRNFARSNRKLLNEGREDVFLQRLKSQFRLASDIGKVSFSNSGRTEAPDRDPATPDELAVRVQHAFEQLESLRETEEGAKAIESHRYAPLRLLSDGELSPTQRLVLEHKKDLIDLVTQYILTKNNATERIFSQRILEVFGFEPCGICCAEEIGFDLNIFKDI